MDNVYSNKFNIMDNIGAYFLAWIHPVQGATD